MVEYTRSPIAELLVSLSEFFQSNSLLPWLRQSVEANHDRAESLERKKWLLEVSEGGIQSRAGANMSLGVP